MNKKTGTAILAVDDQSNVVLKKKTAGSVGRFLKTLITLLALIWVPQLMNAQSDGQTVLISDGNGNYLSVDAANTSAVTNLTTPTEYSLWEVENSYRFKNPKSGKYLYRDGNRNNSYLNTNNGYTTWNLDGNKLYYRNWGMDYAIYFSNNKWDVYRETMFEDHGTPLTFTVMIETHVLNSAPSAVNFSVQGGSQSVSVTATSRWSNSDGSIVIQHPYSGSFSVTAALANSYSNHFTSTASGAQVTVNASTNATANILQTQMTITAASLNASTNVNVAQAAVSNFSHQKGHSGRDLLNNGQQSVHTERIVKYVKPGESVRLDIPESSFTYSRWYQYNTDAAVSVGFLSELSGYTSLLDGKGYYKLSETVSSPLYTNTSTATTGVIAEIACDVSKYVDYELMNGMVLTEPTLSQRVIYEIRPAAEMAARLNAKANSDGLPTGNYLESYEMLAPTGRKIRIGTEYAFTGDGCNYYYGLSTPTQLSDYELYKTVNGATTLESDPIVQNDRVIEIDAINNVGTVIYTLVANGYGIAKFTINYKLPSEVGPSATAIVSEKTFRDSYKYVTGLRFDGDKNTPLEWDESGYGFYYQDWGRDTQYRTSVHRGVHWGEYTLMNVVPDSNYTFLAQGVRDMKYQNDTTDLTGNFFYVDASNTPGLIASLKFKDGGLCPGTRMYVSAWVNNLGTHTRPNLNFSVIGVKLDGVTDVVATYTTGDLDFNENEDSIRGLWHQVFFELTMPKTDYVDYRLRIINNAQNAAGNDFAIDDICVYMQRPNLMTYQASITCSNVNDETAVMVRISPDGLDAIPPLNDVKTIYYKFEKSNGDTVGFKNYANSQQTYGYVEVNKRKDNYKIYTELNGKTGLERYLDELNSGIAVPQAFYVSEKDEKGQYQTILYVYHSTDFKAGTSYNCVLAADPLNFHISNNSCGLTSEFTISPKAKLVLNSRPGGNLDATGLCANQYNGIRLEMFGSKSGLTETLAGSCKADWLEGRADDYDATGRYGIYDYQVICDAIMAFRTSNPTSTDVTASVIDANYTQAQKDLLVELMSRGMLELYKEEIFRRTMNGTTYYTAFPISASATAADGSAIEICESPVVISLSAVKTNPGFIVKENTEKGAPAEVYAQSRVIRMSQNDAMAAMIELPILLKEGLTFEQLRSSDVFLLPTTTDKRITLPFDNNTTANKVYSTSSSAGVDTVGTLSLTNRDSRLDFQQGHRYDFIVVSTVAGEDCQGAGRFSIVVVPDMVMWSPKEESNSWHVDRNWDMIDAQGNVLSTGNGYAPASHTNVVINAGSVIPVLEVATPSTTAKSAITLADDAQPLIEWDLRFVANTCKNIHLGAKAMFAGQDFLTYEKAWVDVALNTNQWNLIAPPFEDMVVGDMYIPSGGDVTPLFTDVASPDSRRVYEFWTSLYNSTGVEKDRYNQTTNISSSEWTTPFNALNTPIVPAHGYSVRVEDHTANAATEVVVRLPKTDETYYYYGTYGEQTNLTENITRTANGHRLAGTNIGDNVAIFTTDVIYDQSVTQHLMANPYMAELDMFAFMADSYNIQNINGKYAIMDANRVQTVIDLVNHVSNGGSMTTECVIPPMTSFMVQLSGSNPQLKVSPSMLKDYKATAASPAPAYAPTTDNRRILTIKGVRNGVTSYCSILEKADGNNNLDDDDTRLMLINSNLTPSGIYTNVENTALSINILSDIHMTPLGYAVIDNSETETLEITFNGVDNFPGQLSLYDAATRKTTTLTEGMTISLTRLVTGGTRYYIYYQPEATDAVEELTQDGNLKVYQPQRGEVVLACSDVMTRVRVYNVNGQLVEDRTMLNSSLESFNLQTGVYLFEVESIGGVYREKIIVR